MAYSAGSVTLTEFAGEYQVAYVDVSPDAATGDITISEYDSVIVLGATFIEDLAATCIAINAKEDATTTNKINIKLWEQDGTAATAYKDFRIAFLGK